MSKQSNWHKYERRALPTDWNQRVRHVRQRAKDQCENVIYGQRCPNTGRECHHAKAPNDHRIESLMWLCHECHDEATAEQSRIGNIARQAKLMHPMQRKRYLLEKLGTTEMPEMRSDRL